MRRRNRTHIPIRPKDKIKINNLRRELAALEGKDVPQHEVIRRTFKIPALPERLRQDAKLKRRLHR